MRNREIPSNVVATRLGYPKKHTGQPTLYGAQRDELLREYSDSQLTTLTSRLEKSRKKINRIMQGSAGLAVTSLFVHMALAATATIEKQTLGHVVPLPTPLIEGFNHYEDFMTRFGVHDSRVDVFTEMGLTILAPGVLASINLGLSDTRTNQLHAVEKEKTRRKIEKLLAEK